jgi:predicted kinase
MIIWINGAFGVGKSTLARELAATIPDCMIMDPEVIGAYLHRLIPDSPTGDYQDLEFWRSLTTHTILKLRRIYRVTVVVPMTMVNPTWLEGIHGTIRKHGESLLHVFLDADESTLRDRIDNHAADTVDPTIDSGVREWRLQQLSRCLAARAAMPEPTLWLDAGALGQAELAHATVVAIDGERQQEAVETHSAVIN